jgi:hypothetical protein
MRVAVGVIALALGLASAPAGASMRPGLRVVRLAPFTVHGYRFKDGEPLRVVITTKRRFVRRIEATGKGTFTIKLRLSIGRCAQYSVRAYGPDGFRAGVKSPPQSCGTEVGPR